MHVERKSFLFLVTAIAGATVATTGCATTDGGDVDSSQAHVETAAPNVSGLSQCVAKPGEGETTLTSNFEEGFCFDLSVFQHRPNARGLVAPSAEGMGTSFNEGVGATMDDFVFDQCNMYRSVYRSGMATALRACLQKADAARRTNGVATKAVDALALYGCGKALFGVCESGIDGRLHQKDASGKDTCERIVDKLGVSEINAGIGPDGSTLTAPFNVATCEEVLSGLRSTGRTQMKACVDNLAGGLDKKDVFYSCMEGLQSDFKLTSAAEAIDGPKNLCFPASESMPVPGADACKAIASQSKIGISDFIESKCNEYRTQFAPLAGATAIECLQSSKNVDNDVYLCGTKGLKQICQDSALDTSCASYVKKLTSVDKKANAGGRATRECRSLMPGLLPDHRAAVLACADKRIDAFAPQGAAKFALFSCVESGGQ